jgi:hypothetical protein
MCQGRFRDGGSALSAWAEPEVLVVCPRCASRGVVRRVEGTARRLTCSHCALSREAAGTTSSWGGPVDPWFGVPLWLAADFRGHVVWAFNAAHLRELRAHLAAGLREHSPAPGAPMSMLERLPAWMTSERNRDSVVAVLDRLADRPG